MLEYYKETPDQYPDDDRPGNEDPDGTSDSDGWGADGGPDSLGPNVPD